jgi:hypothetical protein
MPADRTISAYALLGSKAHSVGAAHGDSAPLPSSGGGLLQVVLMALAEKN